MFHKIREAQQGEREEGFTLIELLVVVIIIGILAAIAIPVFLNQREKARNSAANSDLRNLITAEEAFATESQGNVYTETESDLTNNGLSRSTDVNICVELSGGDDEFSALTWHDNGSLYFYYHSAAGEITKGGSVDGGGAHEPVPANCF